MSDDQGVEAEIETMEARFEELSAIYREQPENDEVGSEMMAIRLRLEEIDYVLTGGEKWGRGER